MEFATYRLHSDEQVKSSPFKIEGTDLVLDIPPGRNIPYKSVAFNENGEARAIRYVRGAKSIYVDEQIAAGIPANRQPTIDELKDLEVINGTLLATRKILIEYLDANPLNAGCPYRQSDSRNFYYKVDPKAEMEAVNSQYKKTEEAFFRLRSLSTEDARELVRLRYSGSANISVLQLKPVLANILEEEGGIDWFLTRTERVGEKKDINEELLSLVMAAKDAGLINFHKKDFVTLTFGAKRDIRVLGQNVAARAQAFADYLKQEPDVADAISIELEIILKKGDEDVAEDSGNT